MTRTKHAEGHLAQRVQTLPALYLDAERVAHVMEIGRNTLVSDLQTFTEGLNQALNFGDSSGERSYRRLVTEFQGYVDEAQHIINLCRGLGDVGFLTFVASPDGMQDLREALDEVEAEERA